jgi:hypothetical protein
VVERSWRSGDRVTIEFQRSLRFVPISPAYPNRAALMYGPVMLVMLSDEGGPLYGKMADPASWIEPIPGEPLHFEIKASDKPRHFLPFYEIAERQPYFAYNEIISV